MVRRVSRRVSRRVRKRKSKRVSKRVSKRKSKRVSKRKNKRVSKKRRRSLRKKKSGSRNQRGGAAAVLARARRRRGSRSSSRRDPEEEESEKRDKEMKAFAAGMIEEAMNSDDYAKMREGFNYLKENYPSEARFEYPWVTKQQEEVFRKAKERLRVKDEKVKQLEREKEQRGNMYTRG